MSRRLPSGSRNILWMWVAVPIGVEIVLRRLLDRRLTLGEDANHPPRGGRFVDQTDGRLARDRERHE